MFSPIQPSPNSQRSLYPKNPNDPSLPYLPPPLPYPLPSNPALQPPRIDPCGSLYPYPPAHTGIGAQSGHYQQQNAVSDGWVIKRADPTTYSSPAQNPLTENSTVSTSVNSTWNNTWMTQPDDASRTTPVQTKVTQSLQCEICKIDCNSKDVFEKHILGKKHKKHLHAYTLPTTALNAMVERTSGMALMDSARPCTVCNIMCNSHEAYNKHLYGKNHAMQAAICLARGGQPVIAANPKSISLMQKKIAKKTNVAQSAWCEVCKIHCNSSDIFSQHLSGKKHQKNMEKLEKSKEGTNGPTATAADPIIGPPENPAVGKRKTSDAAKSVKKVGSSEDLEMKKRKIVEAGVAVGAVKVCTLCNIVCNSESVFTSHLAGQKHLAMLKKSGTGIAGSGS